MLTRHWNVVMDFWDFSDLWRSLKWDENFCNIFFKIYRIMFHARRPTFVRLNILNCQISVLIERQMFLLAQSRYCKV